jgi:hypothetical protein
MASGKCDERVNKVGRMKTEAVLAYVTHYVDTQLGRWENKTKESLNYDIR